MCLDYLGNTISDATSRCILQTLTGTPVDALQDYTIYLVALMLSIVLIYGLFSILMLISKLMRTP